MHILIVSATLLPGGRHGSVGCEQRSYYLF